MKEPSSPVHVRVCRDCGEEYRPEVVRCADCGGALEDRFEGEGQEAAPASAPAPDEPVRDLAGYRALFLTPRAADLVPMAERLREGQIDYRLAEQPGVAQGAPPRYGLFVQHSEAARALGALADLVAPHEGSEGVPAVETRFTEQGYAECPACGARTAPGTVECPECGLGLAGGEGETDEGRD